MPCRPDVPCAQASAREFRDDVVRVARNREDGVTIEQIATDSVFIR
jgi:transposase